MPDYDYQCDRGHVTTLTQSIVTPPPETVECIARDGGGRCERVAKRVFATPTLVFDGTGRGVGHVWQKLAYE